MRRGEWERSRAQARHTLDSARRDAADGDHAWSRFKAHQGAELAVKGCLRAVTGLATGRSVVRLLQLLEAPVAEELGRCAQGPDKPCIPSRYPDVYDAGSPHEYLDAADSAHHTAGAERIITFAEGLADAEGA